jgi:hypothetical protein
MPTFIFAYRLPTRYVPTPETSSQMKAWFEGMGEQLLELGKPVYASETVGNCAPEASEFAGYSIVQAENLAEALAIAKRCPHITRNGGIEVGELGEVPPPNGLTRLSMTTSTERPTTPSAPRLIEERPRMSLK